MYVVTGGAGFIGSNILWGLEERGLGPLVACDRLGSDEKWRNVAKRELTDLVAPEDLFLFLDAHKDAVEAVIHMGAVSSTTEADADYLVKVNFKLSLALWNWCADKGVRFLYASSAATYGDGGRGFDDDGRPGALAKLQPLNAYGWSKHLFDRRVARMVAEGEPGPPQWAGLKFFNVFGPNEYHKGAQQSVVASLYPRAKAGCPARLFESHHPDYANGGQCRDFIWIDDCVRLVLRLLENPTAGGLINVGTGKARTFHDLAAAVYRALGREPEIEFIPTPEEIREKYQYYTQAETSRAAPVMDSFTSLETAVERYVQEFLDTSDPYR